MTTMTTIVISFWLLMIPYHVSTLLFPTTLPYDLSSYQRSFSESRSKLYIIMNVSVMFFMIYIISLYTEVGIPVL
jgi:hypothetical protein